MKQILSTLALVLFILISCNQEEEILYSCNNEINEWVINNKTAIQQMNRHDLLKLSKSKMRAAYNAFTPEQKIKFWESSIDDALKLNWSEEEKAHIQKVRQFIYSHSYFFEKQELSTDESDELEIFFYMWIEFAKENFGWTNDIIIAIAVTGYPLNNTRDVIEPGISDDINKKDCECKEALMIEECGVNSACYTTNKCSITADGCGFFKLGKCNGMCGPK